MRQRNIETASTWLQPSSSAAQLKGYFFKRVDTRGDHYLSPVSQRNKKLRRNLGTKIFEGLFRLEAVDTFFQLLLEKSKSFFMQLSFFSLFEGKKRMWVFIGQEAARVKQARFCSSSFDTQQTFSSSTSRGWVVVRRAIQRMFRQLRKKITAG